MDNLNEQNQMKSFSRSDFGDEKLDKKPQLTSDMSVHPSARDEYEQKIHSIGGNE